MSIQNKIVFLKEVYSVSEANKLIGTPHWEFVGVTGKGADRIVYIVGTRDEDLAKEEAKAKKPSILDPNILGHKKPRVFR